MHKIDVDLSIIDYLIFDFSIIDISTICLLIFINYGLTGILINSGLLKKSELPRM
jgi:hypothetical protein